MSDPVSSGSMVVVAEDSARGPENIAMAIVVVLIGAFLGQVLRFPFIYDDHWTILQNPVVPNLWNLPRLFGFRFGAEGVPDAGRPLMLASVMLDSKLWGLHPLGFHLQNLAWHAGASVLLLLALRHITMSLPLALFGAAIFAVHPLNVEPVSVVNYREDLLAATLMLAGLITLAASRRAPPGRRARARKLGAAILFALAAFAKESAYVAPLVVLLLDTFPARGLNPRVQARGLPPGRGRREQLVDVGLAALSVAAVFVWRALALGQAAVVSINAETAGVGVFFRVLEGAFGFIAGLTHVVYPPGLAPEYNPGVMDGFGLFMAVLAVLATLAVAGVALALRRRSPLIGLGLAFSFVAYLPTFGIIAISNGRADRYFYLPMMGIVLALVATLSQVAHWLGQKLRKGRPPMLLAGTPVVWLLAAVMVAGAGLMARKQSLIWSDEVTLWRKAVETAPNSVRSWTGLASILLQQRRSVDAQMIAKSGMSRFNTDPRLREILGLTYLNQGAVESACAILREAGDEGSAYERAQRASNLGYCWMRLGKLEEALPLFAKSRQLAPWFERGWSNAAETLRRLGRDQEAKQLLDQLDRQ